MSTFASTSVTVTSTHCNRPHHDHDCSGDKILDRINGKLDSIGDLIGDVKNLIDRLDKKDDGCNCPCEEQNDLDERISDMKRQVRDLRDEADQVEGGWARSRVHARISRIEHALEQFEQCSGGPDRHRDHHHHDHQIHISFENYRNVIFA